MADLTPTQIDLLRAGLLRPTPVGDAIAAAQDLQGRGFAVLTSPRAWKLKTTGDGAAALSKATRLQPRPFGGLPAADINDWLQTLPPAPLHGETNA